MTADAPQTFDLGYLGGAHERRYRALRPEVEEMPWASLDVSHLSPDVLLAAQKLWTASAFQEYRTGAHCTQALQHLYRCQAPIDLIALCARFPLDEIVHVELAGRLARALGANVALTFTDTDLLRPPPMAEHEDPLMPAAALMVQVFCVGESLSIPLIHAAWQDASQPLARAVLGCILRDEAAHGMVGWTFLDWADPVFDDDDRRQLGLVADQAIGEILKLWRSLEKARTGPRQHRNGVGWIGTEPYLALASRSMAQKVVRPLLDRAIPVTMSSLPPAVRAHL